MQPFSLLKSLGKIHTGFYSECQAKGLLSWRTASKHQKSLAMLVLSFMMGNPAFESVPFRALEEKWLNWNVEKIMGSSTKCEGEVVERGENRTRNHTEKNRDLAELVAVPQPTPQPLG
jgi:hypothetical protein